MDLDDRIKLTLDRVAHLTVPGGPIDPAALPTRRHARNPRRWLAAAAALVLVAGIGIAAVQLRDPSGTQGVPVQTAPPHTAPPVPGASDPRVEVDVFSGRPNPVVAIDAGVVEELYMMVADQELANPGTPGQVPDAQGFRGFVVTTPEGAGRFDDFLPGQPALRILPDAVYIEREDGTTRLGSQDLYARVYDAIWTTLPADVLDLVPPTDPPVPIPTVDLPPRTGSDGIWGLAPGSIVEDGTTTLTLSVSRTECASGVTGTVLEPTVSYGESEIIIRANVAPLPPGGATCPGNDIVPVTLTLDEPVGGRRLMDALCYQTPQLRYSYCAGGPQRWSSEQGSTPPEEGWPR